MKIFKLLIFCSCVWLTQCSSKEASTVESKDSITAISTTSIVLPDTISFDKIERFKVLDDVNFTADDIKLTNDGSIFHLYKDGKLVKDITFNGVEFEGPGYSCYLYSSSLISDSKLVVIEAQADVGTAWYYVVSIDDELVSNETLVKEPRSNSELHPVDQFISAIKIKDKYTLRFRINLIAKYSQIPKETLVRGDFVYLELSSNATSGAEQKKDTNASEKKLVHLYYANGGLLAFYDDGSVTGCPRCDLAKENVDALLNKQPFAKYTSDKDFLWITQEGSEKEKMDFYVNGKTSEDWAMLKGKWLIKL